MSGIDPIAPVSVEAQSLLYSPLFLTASRLSKPVDTAVASTVVTSMGALFPKETVAFNSLEIANLIKKINPKGIRFEELKQFSPEKLTANEQKIRQYFLANPRVFLNLTFLAGAAQLLTQDAVNKAAAMAGDVKTLSTNDLSQVEQQLATQDLFASRDVLKTQNKSSVVPPATPSPQDANSPSNPQLSLQASQVGRPLPLPARQGQPVSQQTPLLPGTSPVLPRSNPLNPVAASLPLTGSVLPLNAINPLAGTLLQGKPLPASSQPELPRAASGREQAERLTRNEWVRAAAAAQIQELQEAIDEDASPEDVMLDGVERVNAISSTDNSNPPKSFRPVLQARQKINLHAPDIVKVFQNINQGKPITLAHLRVYRPRNKKEEQILNVIKRLKVFEELSALDGTDSTLALEDIQIATDGHAFILSDAYMTLVITPD